MIEDELTKKIIGCAFDVYNELGAGFLESVYKKALVLALRSEGLKADVEVPIEVSFRGHSVGSFYADVLVEDSVILELKAVDALSRAHETQLVNYLKATGKLTGLLINFGTSSIAIKRKYKNPANPGSCLRSS